MQDISLWHLVICRMEDLYCLHCGESDTCGRIGVENLKVVQASISFWNQPNFISSSHLDIDLDIEDSTKN